MINEKMYCLGSQRSEIRELFEYAKRRKAEIGEENVYDFSLGNPSVPCPKEVNSAMASLLDSENPVALHGYTSAEGDLNARMAIAEYLTKLHGLTVSASDLYLTAGAAAALAATLTALVTPGEEVIILAPYFPEYRVFIERCGGVVKEVGCEQTSFMPDVAAIADAISEKTAAIIINSPNNPTGAVYSADVIRELSEMLRRKSSEYGHSIYLIADEPYRELVYDGIDVPFIPCYYEDTVVCYSYSKSLSLAGERIGYVLVSPGANESRRVYSAVCGAGRALGYVCAPSLLQKILPYCTGKTSDINVYIENRQLLFTNLKKYGFDVLRPDGAFYLFVKSPVDNAHTFSEMAKRREIIIVPSDSFGIRGYVRISYCVSTEMIKKALDAFAALARDVGLKGDNTNG